MNEDKINELKDKLQEIFGDDAKIVGAFDGKSINKMLDNTKKYMNTTIVKLSASRTSTNVEINQCSINEVRKSVIHIITHALHLFPKDDRNQILYEAIQDLNDKYDEGMLLMEDENEEDSGEE